MAGADSVTAFLGWNVWMIWLRPSDRAVQRCTGTIQWSGTPTARVLVSHTNTVIKPAPNGSMRIKVTGSTVSFSVISSRFSGCEHTHQQMFDHSMCPLMKLMFT